MQVLLLGAYGFIGSEIARALIARGHAVTGFGRDVEYGQRILPQLKWLSGDLSTMADPRDWIPAIQGVEAIVNASGLLQDGEGGTVETVQLRSIAALIDACTTVGINRFVHISAAGADPRATTDFMRTKAATDSMLQSSHMSVLTVRPGLVIGRNSHGGTELIRAVAALPLRVSLPFEAPIQCVALSEVVEAAAGALDPDNARVGCFDLVERRQRTLGEIIAIQRRWLGWPAAGMKFAAPGWLVQLSTRAADMFGRLGWRSPLRSNAILALQAGVTGDADQTAALLGREPMSLEDTLAIQPAGKQDRLQARLTLFLPLVLASLVVMWAASGVATLLQLDRAVSILDQRALSESWARAAAIAGAWLDIVLAAALLWRRTVRAALMAMILLTLGGYLLAGTLLVPNLWADPLAPFANALPATMLALVAYWMVERR